MDHWQKALPNKVLTVQYEAVIADTEQQLKQLLQHCDLPFEQECLQFYQNKRSVKTASSEQVRLPINNKGVDLWTHFREKLMPLQEALGVDTLKRFEQFIN